MRKVTAKSVYVTAEGWNAAKLRVKAVGEPLAGFNVGRMMNPADNAVQRRFIRPGQELRSAPGKQAGKDKSEHP